jgi:hypothetical protein
MSSFQDSADHKEGETLLLVYTRAAILIPLLYTDYRLLHIIIKSAVATEMANGKLHILKRTLCQ